MWIYNIKYLIFILNYLSPNSWLINAQQDSGLQKCGRASWWFGGDERANNPWSAIIFHKNKESNGIYIPWVSGIIIGPSTIITRGRHFWEARKQVGIGVMRLKGFKSSNYLVGVGIQSMDSFNPDQFTQILQVEYIRPHPKSFIEHSENDFAIIQLLSNITFSRKVAPICLPYINSTLWNSFIDIPNSYATVRISGYSREEHKIFATNNNITTSSICNGECQRIAPSSTEAQLQNGGRLPCVLKTRTAGKPKTEDSFVVGAGVTTWISHKWILVGIVTKTYGCSSDFTHFISLISSSNLAWITGNVQNGARKYTCLNGVTSINLELLCNGQTDCLQDGGSDEDSIFCEAWKCSKRSLSSHLCDLPSDSIARIRNGSNSIYSVHLWKQPTNIGSSPSVSTNQPPKRTNPKGIRKITTIKPIGSIKCPPLRFTGKERQGIKFQCLAPRSLNSDCVNNALPGTKVLVTCLPHYKSGSGISFSEITCGSNGNWIRGTYFGCVLECGVPKVSISDISNRIVNGTIALGSNWPWNAALFRHHIKHGYSYICGATLITSKSLLTAAHCLFSERQLVDLANFRIVLAPISSSFTRNLNDQHVQFMEIESAIIHENYNSIAYESDIAIIKTKGYVEISDYVYPACFPFPGRENGQIERIQTSPGNTGIVVGFGVDETLSISKNLRQIQIPIVGIQECYRELDIFPTSTQMCGGYKTGVSVCNGDSGAGLLFQEGGPRKLFFIQGIVCFGQSVKLAEGRLCDANRYSIFTRVGAFKEWVERFVYND